MKREKEQSRLDREREEQQEKAERHQEWLQNRPLWAIQKDALKKKLVSQSTKKAMKNTARLPRTAGLRTLSELTTEMTKAGLDPSRIQERAEILAKAQGAKRKREREEEEAEMDVDGPGAEDGEGDWMDVDE